jgi:hypothetical protein
LSRQVRREPFDFPAIGFPHRNDSPRDPSGSPRKDHNLVIQRTHCDKTQLSILPTIVHARQVSAREYVFGVSEVEFSLGERLVPLGPIKCNSDLL